MTKKATKKVTKKMALCSFSWYSPLEERKGRELHGWKICTFLQTLIKMIMSSFEKNHQQCHPHSPLQQMKPWNQSLVALGRSAAPRCRLTSANLHFGFLNTCQRSQISQHVTWQQSQISPHNSSTKWDVDLSGVWPIVLGTGREAQVSSKARAGRWLDAVSCEELFSPQT